MQTFSVSRNEKFWRRKNVWEQSIKRLWHFLKVKFQFNQRRRRTAALENLKSEIIWELMADIPTSSGKKKLYKNMWNSLKTKDAIAEIGTEHTAVWIWENSSSSERRKEITLPLWQLGSFLESPKKEVILYGHTTKNAMWVSHVMSILICPKKKNSLLVQNLGKMTEKNVLDLLGYLMCHFVFEPGSLPHKKCFVGLR